MSDLLQRIDELLQHDPKDWGVFHVRDLIFECRTALADKQSEAEQCAVYCDTVAANFHKTGLHDVGRAFTSAARVIRSGGHRLSPLPPPPEE